MWSEGIIACPTTGGKYKYWVKHYEEGSQFGIDGGKVSKLTIRKVGESRDLCNYDRGWDIEPTGEVKAVYAIILEKYN
jgi:hypothetical protein